MSRSVMGVSSKASLSAVCCVVRGGLAGACVPSLVVGRDVARVRGRYLIDLVDMVALTELPRLVEHSLVDLIDLVGLTDQKRLRERYLVVLTDSRAGEISCLAGESLASCSPRRLCGG